MNKIYFSITFFMLSINSLFGQIEIDRYFMEVNHFENLHDDFSWVESSDQKTYETSDKTYLIVEIPLLLTPYIGDKEYVLFDKFEFDTELAYFDLEGEFQRITLVKNKVNVKSKNDLYEVLDYLDWRFKSHTYSNGIYTYENAFIKILAAFDQAGNLLVQSQPKL